MRGTLLAGGFGDMAQSTGLTRRAVMAGLLAVAAVAPAACGDVLGKRYPPYRYRLTVEVDTPLGLRTGSSVIEVRDFISGPYTIPVPGSLSVSVRGQAAAVDLPDGQTLFALLRSDWDSGWAENVYALQIPRPTTEEVAARSPDGKWNGRLQFDMWMERVLASRGVIVVPRYRELFNRQVSAWPMLARFRDLRDPASVERVDPDNLPATFGKGYAIRRVTVERTDDPVTFDIDERLRWISQMQGSLAEQPRDANGYLIPLAKTPLAVRLNSGDFKRGRK